MILLKRSGQLGPKPSRARSSLRSESRVLAMAYRAQRPRICPLLPSAPPPTVRLPSTPRPAPLDLLSSPFCPPPHSSSEWPRTCGPRCGPPANSSHCKFHVAFVDVIQDSAAGLHPVDSEPQAVRLTPQIRPSTDGRASGPQGCEPREARGHMGLAPFGTTEAQHYACGKVRT